MSKDKSLLESVSKYFTENALQNIVAKVCKEDNENIKVISWDFGNASKVGDSYLGKIDRIVIKSRVKDEVKEVRIVVKSLPNNIGRRKTYRLDEFFHNEIIFYSELVPKFKKFLESKNQSSLLRIPECLAFHCDGVNDFLTLEDVSPYGFGPASRENCLTFEPCRHMVEAMARFHGISFAFKDQEKEEFENVVSKLTETYFSKNLYESWYQRFHEKLIGIAKDALAKEYPGSYGETRFNSYKLGEMYLKSSEFCDERRNFPSSVVNQGDAWAPNFLFRTDPSGKIDVMMLDFQLARCCSPIADLSFFLYSCTNKTLRDKHFDDLLKIYYNEVARTINILNSDPEKIYSWDFFSQEVKEQFIIGVTFGLESITFSMLSDEESFDLDGLKEDKVDIADVWKVQNIKIPANRRRLADMILHAADKGYL